MEPVTVNGALVRSSTDPSAFPHLNPVSQPRDAGQRAGPPATALKREYKGVDVFQTPAAGGCGSGDWLSGFRTLEEHHVGEGRSIMVGGFCFHARIMRAFRKASNTSKYEHGLAFDIRKKREPQVDFTYAHPNLNLRQTWIYRMERFKKGRSRRAF